MCTGILRRPKNVRSDRCRVTLSGDCTGRVVAGIASGDERVWTDATGDFRVSAELLAIDGDYVILSRPDGKKLRVRFEQLSAEDQAFARKAFDLEKQPDDVGGPNEEQNSQPASRSGVDAAKDIREAAIAFFQGLRAPDRNGAREFLTAAARQTNRDPDSPLAQLPTPDPGKRSVLVGRAATYRRRRRDTGPRSGWKCTPWHAAAHAARRRSLESVCDQRHLS